MAEKPSLLGRSTLSPVDNKRRKEVVLPGQRSQNFILTARCRIVNVGTRIPITAADLPGESGGSYSWTTASTHIRLINNAGPTVAVEGLSIGTARDSETITCTRRGADGATTTKTVTITVAKVTFLQASTQKFGFDDYDTPADHTDDHISIGSEEETFIKVKIEGGAVGTDFTFLCEDTTACTVAVPPGSAEFDLSLRAGRWQKKTTKLRARVKCPSVAIFATIAVHIYNQTVVKVLIAKVADTRSPGTSLRFATADYAAHQNDANLKLREAVVRYELTNFDAANQVTNVAFDNDNNGALSYDINSNGGRECELIRNAVRSTVRDQKRVVIIRKMKSLYYLDRPARRGETSIVVRGSNVFSAEMPLGAGPTLETVEVISNTGNIGQLAAPLAFDHVAGEPLEFPAAGWGGDPILIAEGNDTLDVAKWTILHEVGHTALNLMDIVDPTDFMHFDQSNTDYRLRYCPRQSRYNSGTTENQWETIPRPTLRNR
ncbi:hypothetical protein Jab_2c10350 [Janthinobacterium sp. HH01]|uniref:hypothetical protein n=1 Tax=Janthinobacterium sp. HH01 TaxID=1198452 RepID=UPI0002AEA4B3|nr:hypothetical protein [Janthinobacterium sp. HH01]ELX08977.1 hypothetical protein Jab_2c10350 [Janthinobacterium sp. HH01]